MEKEFEEGYFEGVESQFEKGDRERFMSGHIRRGYILKLAFNPESALELGCSFGDTVDTLNNVGVETKGVDISKYTTKGNKNLICGDVAVVDFPKAELVYSFDLFEHLDSDQIEKVMNRLDFDSMFISISTSFQEYGDVTHIPNMDKTHISMHTPSWWFDKFYERFSETHFINMMTRTDFEIREEKKFTNTNFMLTKKKLTELQNL